MSVKQNENIVDLKALATQIAVTCGPCQVLVLGSEPGRLLRALSLAGLEACGHALSASDRGSPGSLSFADESFDAVVLFDGLESCSDESLLLILAEIKRVTRRSLILSIDIGKVEDDSLRTRRGWEIGCFDAGFRKHPLYYRINDYASLERDGERVFIPLEKVPADAWSRYPMDSLREERDLHMDMLRESGSRSDAHVGRYHFAAGFIRPGDVVLDAACGLGYGTYVVRSETRARSFIGIDASEYGIDYAQLNFGGENTSFRRGMLPDCLAGIPDDSIDHVLCFETLEHVQDPVRLLAEFQRVLTPGGRLTCSVPHDWSDETGLDPNPFHFHVYDKKRFVAELSQYFDLERLVGQTADRIKKPGGGCIWLKRPRSLTDIPVDQDEIEAEWLLAVAAKSPLDGRRVPYREHVFSADEQREAGNALAFMRDYSNPWLIRSMVSIGLRTENTSLRSRWAEAVWNDAETGAADRGAALCVLAYCALANSDKALGNELLERIDGYLAHVVDESNPNVLRWRVSLMYVGGLLALSRGVRDTAQRYFGGVIKAPVADYSATLLTKPAEAAYLLGLLLAGQGRGGEAERIWWDAFQRISTSLGERLIRGYEARPAVFEIRELAVTLALCGRLVAAAAHAGDLAQRPGIFYDECHADSVFGLESFAAVEHLLADLRRDFLEQQTGLDQLERGKGWLEQQWNALQQEIRLRDDELSHLSGAKDWLEAQTASLQAELLRQRNTSAEAFDAVKMLEEGKAWLETQWRTSEGEREHLRQAVATLEAGKAWLEGQWRALEDVLERKSTALEQVQESKLWVEAQWKAAQQALAHKTAELETVLKGKRWLEAQWEAGQQALVRQTAELETVLEGKRWLEAQWEAGQQALARQTAELESLLEGKAWLEGQWEAAKRELASVKTNKDLLETQWCTSQEALARQAAELECVFEGKRWLESQWEAAKSELVSLTANKDWLEYQWMTLQEQLRAKDVELEALSAGKEWLESQWKSQGMELDVRQQHLEVQRSEIGRLEAALAGAGSRLAALGTDNARLAADLEIARDKAAQLKQSRFFKLARKLGFFEFF